MLQCLDWVKHLCAPLLGCCDLDRQPRDLEDPEILARDTVCMLLVLTILTLYYCSLKFQKCKATWGSTHRPYLPIMLGLKHVAFKFSKLKEMMALPLLCCLTSSTVLNVLMDTYILYSILFYSFISSYERATKIVILLLGCS